MKQNAKKLNHSEMKQLKGGAVGTSVCRTGSCSYYEANTGNVTGTCQTNTAGNCVCKAGSSSVVHGLCSGAGDPPQGAAIFQDAWGVAAYNYMVTIN